MRLIPSGQDTSLLPPNRQSSGSHSRGDFPTPRPPGSINLYTVRCLPPLVTLASGLLLACAPSPDVDPGAPLLIAEGGIPERWIKTECRTVEVVEAPAG